MTVRSLRRAVRVVAVATIGMTVPTIVAKRTVTMTVPAVAMTSVAAVTVAMAVAQSTDRHGSEADDS
jgi:hypothetical protein